MRESFGKTKASCSDLREQRCDDRPGDFFLSLKLHLNQDWTATAFTKEKKKKRKKDGDIILKHFLQMLVLPEQKHTS